MGLGSGNWAPLMERHRITVSRRSGQRKWPNGRKGPAKADKPNPSTFRLGQGMMFTCRHEGCNQKFSRKYTLLLHERTHEHAAEYYYWKKQPMIGKTKFPGGAGSK